MYDIVGKRRWYFLFSALITIPGLIFIVIGGLKPSVDYTGGTVWQVHYADAPSAAQVQAALVDLGHPEAAVKDVGGGFLEIRTDPVGLLPPQTPVPTPEPTATPGADSDAGPERHAHADAHPDSVADADTQRQPHRIAIADAGAAPDRNGVR